MLILCVCCCCLSEDSDSDTLPTALHVAAYYGHVDMMRLLLEQKSINPCIPNEQGCYPLEIACWKGTKRDETRRDETTRHDTTPHEKTMLQRQLNRITHTARRCEYGVYAQRVVHYICA